MKIFILSMFVTLCSIACASNSNEIENVYIDALIQRYKIMEDNLWQFVNDNRLLQPISVLDKIINEHQTVFLDNGLEELMFNVYRLKFQFYYETNSFQNCSEEDRLMELLNDFKVPEYLYETLTSTYSQIYCVDRVTSYYKKNVKKPIQLFGYILKVKFRYENLLSNDIKSCSMILMSFHCYCPMKL